MWGHGSRHAPAVTPGSSSWAIARATAPRWLGSNCWVREGAGGRGGPSGTGDPGSPFSLRRLRDAVRLETACADPEAPRGAVHHGAHALTVGIPAPIRLIVRVADVVSARGAFAAALTDSRPGAVWLTGCD